MASRWMYGQRGRPVAEMKADQVAGRMAAASNKVHLTDNALVMANGALRCQVCNGRAIGDVDELKCLQCSRTLAWIGIAPIKQEIASAEVAEERTSDQHRKAAQARWNGRSGQCLKGHKIEGDNAMQWAGRLRCRQCYLDAHKVCPRGHEYTPENTKLTRNGKRRCRTCDDPVGMAARQLANNAVVEAALALFRMDDMREMVMRYEA